MKKNRENIVEKPGKHWRNRMGKIEICRIKTRESWRLKTN